MEIADDNQAWQPAKSGDRAWERLAGLGDQLAGNAASRCLRGGGTAREQHRSHCDCSCQLAATVG
jgi:hypothetical protein